jgi:DNA-binding MarR family transcriptional regulator
MLRDLPDSLKANLAAIGESCVCLHARMTARAVTRAFDQVLQPLGLEATQFSLLAAIAFNPPSSITQLADRMAIERTSLSRNLSLLQKRGLIMSSDGGRRRVFWAVSPEGEHLLRDAIPLWQQVQSSLVNAIGPATWDDMRQDLRALRRRARSTVEHVVDRSV